MDRQLVTNIIEIENGGELVLTPDSYTVEFRIIVPIGTGWIMTVENGIASITLGSGIQLPFGNISAEIPISGTWKFSRIVGILPMQIITTTIQKQNVL